MKKVYLLSLLMIVGIFTAFGQSKNATMLADSIFKGLKMRSIGPALMSGRIADIAIHPQDDNLWYVAVGSGGVWKTKNAGVTWTPVFDDQPVYSIGCVTIDPNNPHTVWVGTGENVGGRHVGFGDGVYKSEDGGANWKNMGLKNSRHISRIIVHPENSNVVWVASQGPLWNKGGDRGLYKSIDGGKSWEKTLGDDEWIGVTDLVIDPRNPDLLYAATWQRHRNVAAYMGGGPGTAIYKSVDGGDNWQKLNKGLPDGSMGKIGLAISPQNPDVLYAAIELNRREGGVYKSTDRGASWSKQSDAVSGATGPHYYQELYASPHKFDRIYLVDVRMQVSDDGGKTFRRMKEENKHSDNHAIAFRKDDPDYLLVGTDGGLYESFDLEENWRFIANLPVTQFYKVALDDSEPFYFVYGGTQDNNTQGGPSRTDNVHGIRNADWFITLFGDGHQPATEPGNPDIVYSEWQEGNLVRVDRTTGEIVYIKPIPDEGEVHERFNWDAPILISPHSPSRVYYASQRVWRSDNRGDSWEAISGDLTRNQERIELPIMGSTQSWDAAWDLYAMSNYNTITSLAESPVQEGLIYAGTDAGMIQVSENGGENWRKIEVGSLPGVPATAFVNDIKADLYDANTVYLALDNHKFGDFTPYLLKSTDKGRSWKSIVGNIPDQHLIWRMVQDHEKPELLFVATEFGIYFTVDAGNRWVKIQGDVPTISFRDLAIQKRENDLVGASFGRGFYIFDDYSLLREVSEAQLQQEATLFTPRDVWWYIERPVLDFDEGKASQGAAYYIAPNPPFGANFTYYLKDGYKTLEEQRKEDEKKKREQDVAVKFPGWDQVEMERRQPEPMVWLTIKDSEGNTVRRIEGNVSKGFHQINWDLRYPDTQAINMDNLPDDESREPKGFLVAPGNYTAELFKKTDGKVTQLSEPVTFTVKQLHKGALPGAPKQEVVAFWQDLAEVQREYSAVNLEMLNANKQLQALAVALKRTPEAPGELDEQLNQIRQKLYDLDEQMNGNRSKSAVGEKTRPTIGERINIAIYGTGYSTYGPTPTHEKSLDIAQKQLSEINKQLQDITGMDLPGLEKSLLAAGAPVVK